MDKKLPFLLVALLLLPWMVQNAQAQQHYSCGTIEYNDEYFAQHPDEEARYRKVQRDYQAYIANGGNTSGTRMVRTIPCVVHVVQSSAVDELSDAQILSQIDVLNEDFRKIAGTTGDGSGVDTEFEFCLASIDPQGCPTTGINRVINPALASHDRADQAIFKGLIQWDPNMYLNIWVPKDITTSNQNGSVIGYATLPDRLPVSPQLDGIVVHAGFFGRTSDATYIGRTATHEVGHWLGLWHTFQDGCAGATASDCNINGDEVCDTPQASDPNFGCPNVNSCTDSPSDLPDQIANYMDYSNGVCQDMFTQGQKDRMDFFYNTYRSNLSSASNLSATGCDGTVSSGCAPTTVFSADIRTICTGQSVTFSDLSSGPPTTWNWTFQGGTPATSTDKNPVVTWTQPGIYNVSLEVTNATGTDSRTETSFITVQETQMPPLSENFDNILFYPDNWYTENLGDALNWRKSGEASYSGTFSMKLELFAANNQGAFYNLNTASYDLSGFNSASLSWNYAYKRYSAFNNIDTLLVRASSDCGATWNTLWEEAGTQLATVGGNGISIKFVPTDTSQWGYAEVPIDSFAGLSDVRFQFRAISGGGQTIWLDNVNLSTLVSAGEAAEQLWNIEVYPNPFREMPTVAYSLAKGTDVSFTLTDLQGKALYQHAAGRQAPGEYVLDQQRELYQALPAGIYFLRAESEFGQVTKKLIKMAQ